MPTILLQLLTHVATRSVSSSSAAVSATHSPCRLCCWLCLLSFTTRTWCLSWLCCSFSSLDIFRPRPVTGWQMYAPSAASDTTTWCNALSALSLTVSPAPASTKGFKAFYAWKLLIAYLLITVWRNCYVAQVGLFILMMQATRILWNSCNASKSTIPSLPWLLSLQKPRRPLATGHWLCGGSPPDRQLFLVKFVYKNIRVSWPTGVLTCCFLLLFGCCLLVAKPLTQAHCNTAN